MSVKRLRAAVALLTVAFRPALAAASESTNLDYIVEHLFEVAMDNRLAALSLHNADVEDGAGFRFDVQPGYQTIDADRVGLRGWMVALGAQRALTDAWSIRGNLFYDGAEFAGSSNEYRLSPTYLTEALPLALPAKASFGRPSGSLIQKGLSLAVVKRNTSSRWSGSIWTVGAVSISQSLENVSIPFTIREGASVGAAGTVDYSAGYSFVAPFVGMQWNFDRVDWTLIPHARYVFPFPRRGFKGRISGAGFSKGGDSGAAGQGKYVSDQQIAVGFTLLHRPSRIAVDVGSSVIQHFVEPVTHNGIDRNWLVSFDFSFD